jgi:hypothetical protein
MFLARMNKDIDEVKGRVFGKIPLPTLRGSFVEIIREKARQGIMMGKTPQRSEYEGSTLATRNIGEGKIMLFLVSVLVILVGYLYVGFTFA